MKPRKDVGAPVRARLLRLVRERGDDFQLLLTRYASERLLYRLARSQHGASFILKGATLFTVWTGHPCRATRDVDLLGIGDPSEARIAAVFAEVLALDVGDDGVVFDLALADNGERSGGDADGGVDELVAEPVHEVHRAVKVAELEPRSPFCGSRAAPLHQARRCL
jgi:Nucleotidyl transferase AbiEii toxin, Type IV TA system